MALQSFSFTLVRPKTFMPLRLVSFLLRLNIKEVINMFFFFFFALTDEDGLEC